MKITSIWELSQKEKNELNSIDDIAKFDLYLRTPISGVAKPIVMSAIKLKGYVYGANLAVVYKESFDIGGWSHKLVGKYFALKK